MLDMAYGLTDTYVESVEFMDVFNHFFCGTVLLDYLNLDQDWDARFA